MARGLQLSNSMKRIAVLLFALLTFGCADAPGDPHALMCLVAFDAAHAELMLEAADEWHDATAGAVALRFEYASDEASCSDDAVTLHLVRDLRGPEDQAALGATSEHRTWIQFESSDDWLWTFGTTARHELGHYLTAAEHDHSDDERDIMFPHWTPEQNGHLTARDVARFYQ